MAMDLYVWGGEAGAEDFLRDWSNGTAVVLASSIEEARDMLRKQIGHDHEDIEKQPKVFPITEPISFLMWGGS